MSKKKKFGRKSKNAQISNQKSNYPQFNKTYDSHIRPLFFR